MLVIEKQGAVIQMKDLALSTLYPSKPAKRGKVTEFSDASRRRLIDLAARLDVKHKVTVFLTLTFSGTPHPDVAKVSFRRFLKRLKRKFPLVSALWRAEMQTRGSPHFHLILFHMPYWKQAQIQATWEQCTGEERSIVDIRMVRSHKRVMSYVSKYIAKKEIRSLDNASYLTDDLEQQYDDVEMRWQGRAWGIHNSAYLPIAERKTAVIRDPEIAAYFWSMVRLNSNYKGGKTPFAAKLFTQHAQAIFDKFTSMSCAVVKRDDFEPDNRYMSSRSTRKRICRFFEIRAVNARKGCKARTNDKALSSFGRLPLPAERV